jgi:ubiquitin-protein ligase
LPADRREQRLKKSPRIRRLEADFRGVHQLAAESSIFDFQATGTPPEVYRFFFHGPGTWKTPRHTVAVHDRHEIVVTLGASYPRMMPHLNWQTPIFHPNISSSGIVCLGGYGSHWVPSLRLEDLAVMLWDMIRYANCDVQSPYNREAALWAREQTDFRFPLDPRPLRNLVSVSSRPAQSSAESGRRPPVLAAPVASKPDTWEQPASARRQAEVEFVGSAATPDAQDILFLD